MLVNPRLFSYRLIIGSLLVVLTALGVYSFTNYKSIKSYENFLVQEKVLIEKELSEILSSYDELSQDYDLLSTELQEAKLETKIALDSLRLLKGDLSIITKFKNQLSVIKTKSRVLLSTIDSLNAENLRLKEEQLYALNTIENKSKNINKLKEVNASLNKSIDEAAVLKASHIEATSYKLKSGKKRFSEKAKRVNTLDICIYLPENPLTQEGKKDIYVQIVSPQGNVIADKGEVRFGDTSLLYSQKEVVNYNNESLEFCSQVVADTKDQPLQKGIYYVNVFHQNQRIGSTSITLK